MGDETLIHLLIADRQLREKKARRERQELCTRGLFAMLRGYLRRRKSGTA